MKRVLVIDDDIRHDKMMSYLLLSRGFEVEYIPSGEEAVKRLKSGEAKKPDVILLDIMMPGMDGVAVLGELRASAMLGDIPVIIISAVTDPKKIDEIKALGVTTCIKKPFSPSNVIDKINEVMRSGGRGGA